MNAPAGKAASHLWSITGSSQSAERNVAVCDAFRLPRSLPSRLRVSFEPQAGRAAPCARFRRSSSRGRHRAGPTPAPELPNLAFAEKFTAATACCRIGQLRRRLMPMPQAPREQGSADKAEAAKKLFDDVPPVPERPPSVEPDYAPGERHGNGERQHSSGESLPQPKADPAPAAREAAASRSPRFEPWRQSQLHPGSLLSRKPRRRHPR